MFAGKLLVSWIFLTQLPRTRHFAHTYSVRLNVDNIRSAQSGTGETTYPLKFGYCGISSFSLGDMFEFENDNSSLMEILLRDWNTYSDFDDPYKSFRNEYFSTPMGLSETPLHNPPASITGSSLISALLEAGIFHPT